jgi:hypothetical protein
MNVVQFGRTCVPPIQRVVGKEDDCGGFLGVGEEELLCSATEVSLIPAYARGTLRLTKYRHFFESYTPQTTLDPTRLNTAHRHPQLIRQLARRCR